MPALADQYIPTPDAASPRNRITTIAYWVTTPSFTGALLIRVFPVRHRVLEGFVTCGDILAEIHPAEGMGLRGRVVHLLRRGHFPLIFNSAWHHVARHQKKA